MKQTGTYFLVFVLVMFLGYCNSIKQYTNKKAKNLHYPESDLLDVNAVAYHQHDSATDVFVQIRNENLLYKRTDTSNAFYAELRVTYFLFAEQNSKKILDSSSFYLFDKEGAEVVAEKSLSSQFRVKAKFGNDYILSIEVIDLNRKSRNITNLNIYKHDKLSAQNFLLNQGGFIAFKNSFFKNQTVRIYTPNYAINKLFVQSFTKPIGPALPPFSANSREDIAIKPDSTFQIERVNNRFVINTPEQGFYFLKGSQETNQGLCLFTFDASFPGVSNMDEMIWSCRYIMNKEEFDTCNNSTNKKLAIDNFWLGVGGSHERAREVLKKYYARVKEANQNFTSYMQGWKTDRGMISIVFGTPTNIYKSKKDEIWVYGLETNPSALRFIFKKEQNPLSDNDYVLERSSFYKEAYFQAVDFWRQGVVYSEKGLDK